MNEDKTGLVFVLFILSLISIYLNNGIVPGSVFAIACIILSIINLKYKRGLTYVSLIGSLCVLAFYIFSAAISVKTANNIVSKAKENAYKSYERNLGDQARIYIISLNTAFGNDDFVVTDDELVENNYLTKYADCKGYVIVNQNEDRYDAYISCKNYETDGYDSKELNNKKRINDINKNFIKKIDLTNITEEVKVDNNLTIQFIGTQSENNLYEYIAKIYLNGNLVKNDLFSDENTKVIWSSNQAATFTVEKIDSLYFIVSSVASQKDGDYILIINDVGRVVKSFSDVKFTIDENNSKITIQDCKNDRVDEICFTEEYSILEDIIVD